MKTICKKLLVVGGLLLFSNLSFAVENHLLGASAHGDCEANCYRSEIVNITDSGEGCSTYEVRIFTEGSCAHALSHYTVEVPECADITNVSNSQGWKQEIGKDPTSGLKGFKIDDIEGFGDDDDSLESFTVTFTVCNLSSCDVSCWAPRVAYKASTCIYIEETEISCVNLQAHLEPVDVSCNGAADGSIAAIVDEGNGPFTYSWSNGSTEGTLTGLPAGDYGVTITDADGNVLELDTTIFEPEAIEVTGEITNATCAGYNDGSIAINVVGGSGDYTYQWSNGSTEANISNLSAGNYFLTITDSEGCSINERFVVASNVTINLSASVTKASCAEANGAIDLTVSGGTGPYTYAWDNGSTTEDLTNLAADIYSVTLTDANGCTKNGTFVVQENNPLSLTATTTKTGCVEDNTGSIDLTVTGGLEPYTYVWTNGASSQDLENLSAGMYTVEVTDQNGCSATLRAVVAQTTFNVEATVEAVSCNGASDGSITLTPSGGVEPYQYAWSNGATTSSISGVEATLYRVIVTDASGCEKSLTYVVGSPAAISASANVSNPSCEASGYAIDLEVTGGSGSYTYDWSNGSSSQDLDGIEAGTYDVIITDTNGCASNLTVVVDENSVDCDAGGGDSGDGGDNGDGDDGSGDGSDGGDDGSGDGGDGSDGGDDGSDGGDGSDDGGDDDSDDGNNGNGKNCDNPYSSSIELVEINEGCYTYRINVEYSGVHSHGLSHMSVAIGCGDFSEAINDGNWPVEIGTDPTTGIKGFKFDDISGFGEGEFADSFEGSFTICTDDDDCAEQLNTADFEVAYKYGQCVAYENVDGQVNITGAVSAYPNPFRSVATIEFTSGVATKAVVELYNQRGYKVKTVFEGDVRANETNAISFSADDLPNDMYTYKVSTQHQVYYGKLVKY